MRQADDRSATGGFLPGDDGRAAGGLYTTKEDHARRPDLKASFFGMGQQALLAIYGVRTEL